MDFYRFFSGRLQGPSFVKPLNTLSMTIFNYSLSMKDSIWKDSRSSRKRLVGQKRLYFARQGKTDFRLPGKTPLCSPLKDSFQLVWEGHPFGRLENSAFYTSWNDCLSFARHGQTPLRSLGKQSCLKYFHRFIFHRSTLKDSLSSHIEDSPSLSFFSPKEVLFCSSRKGSVSLV